MLPLVGFSFVSARLRRVPPCLGRVVSFRWACIVSAHHPCSAAAFVFTAVCCSTLGLGCEGLAPPSAAMPSILPGAVYCALCQIWFLDAYNLHRHYAGDFHRKTILEGSQDELATVEVRALDDSAVPAASERISSSLRSGAAFD